MFKNLKMGVKMTLGFGLVIALVITVGVIAILNVMTIQTQSERLMNEYVPETEIAMELERDVANTMYNMRGYSLTYSDKYLQLGEQGLTKVDAELQRAEDLANKYTQLTVLKNHVTDTKKQVADYKALKDTTVNTINEIIDNRAVNDTAAADFMEEAGIFLISQKQQQAAELEQGASTAAITQRIQKVEWMNDIIDLGNEARVANFKAQALNDTTYFDSALTSLDQIPAIMTRLRSVTVLNKDLTELDAIDRARDNYRQAVVTIKENYGTLSELNSQRNAAANGVTAAAIEVSEAGINNTEAIAADAVAKIQAAIVVIITGLLIALILAVIIAIFLTRIIVISLRKGVQFATSLSKGDLTTKLDVYQKDELGILADSLRSMSEHLTDVVGDIRGASDNVASGSEQISSTAQQMSQGATEQAASAEEVSSSMEEMSSNIRQNAENSLQTEKIAMKAANDATEGGKAVSQTVQAMKDIAERITIIEEISRNTDLLALNAAIEAARAGEHGKGFAVVASEVRKLAERSQKAAGEISELSTKSVSVAEEAGKMLEQIVPDIQKTAELVQEISAASNEQNSGADQISKAITQLDQVIQQNASASEEMASMSEELSSQANQLQTTISFFKVDGTLQLEDKRKKKPEMQHIQSHAQRQKTTGQGKQQQQQQQTGAKKQTTGIALAEDEQKEKSSSGGAKKQQGKQSGKGIVLDLSEGSGGKDKMDDDFEEF